MEIKKGIIKASSTNIEMVNGSLSFILKAYPPIIGPIVAPIRETQDNIPKIFPLCSLDILLRKFWNMRLPDNANVISINNKIPKDQPVFKFMSIKVNTAPNTAITGNPLVARILSQILPSAGESNNPKTGPGK